ncbi:MAG: MurR/RpiR family transcriptional regulator [Bacteroidia bacterium]|nr:MurR/RpiR family transcriptional regulator [Bacteroidia bacterium]
MDIISTIKENLLFLPPIQKKIGTFVVSNPKKTITMSISSLAEASGARSEASVVKFYKSLGFNGYHEFKVNLATEIANQSNLDEATYTKILPNDRFSTIRNAIYKSAIKVLEINNNSLEDDILIQIIEKIENANRIILFGYGTSGVAAYDLYIKLSRLGINCHYNKDEHASAIILSNPLKGDLVFCFSFSGETKSLVAQVEAIKGIIPVVTVGGELNSQLSKLSDIFLPIQSFETTYRNEPIVSRYAQLAVVDIIFTSIANKVGKDGETRLQNARKGLSFLKF